MDLKNILPHFPIFENLSIEDIQFLNSVSTLEKYEAGKVLIEEGTLADCLYIIISGSVQIYKEGNENKVVIIARLDEGTYFGELGYFNNLIRTANVRTLTEVNLIKIDYDTLDKIFKKSDSIRKLLTSTQIERMAENLESELVNINFAEHEDSKRKIKEFDAEIIQFKDNFQGLEVFYTKYIFKNRLVLCAKVVDQPIFIISTVDIEPQHSLNYKKGGLISRKIKLTDTKIVSISSTGQWEELNVLCTMLLKEIQPPIISIEDFSKYGNLLSISSNFHFYDTDLICFCMNVTYKEIKNAIEKGCTELSDIVKITKASTACGSCQNNILDILGKASWNFATIQAKEKITNDVYSFILKPLHTQFLPFLAGQYVLIKLQVNNFWIERAYTLISVEQKAEFYEVMIKCREGGDFSPWLFQHGETPVFIWVSHPRGKFVLDQKAKQTIICFANGIGVTPFIAFIRNINLQPVEHRIHVVYSVQNLENIYLTEDMQFLLNSKNKMTLEIWNHERKGSINNSFIEKLIASRKPDAVYICGSKRFENEIKSKLNEIQFDKNKIFTEVFLPSA